MTPRLIALIVTSVALVLLSIIVCHASPVLVCDPNSTAIGGYYEIKEGNTVIVAKHPAETDGSVKYDLSGIFNGNHSWTVRVGKTDPIWGEMWSTTVPFAFERPAGTNPSTNYRIIK